jgi:type II secretory pathway component PulK
MIYRPQATERQGIVLLLVLIVVVMLSLAAYQYSGWMTSEHKTSKTVLRAVQARALAESGIHFSASLLSNPTAFSQTLNGNPYSSSLFQNQGSDASGPGRFSLVAPNDTFDGYRFGVTDETGKINLNALVQLDKTGNLASQILQLLPNMTPDIADAIIDWIDADDTPRPNGAESQYYGGLNPPYQPRNGPIDSLEELLLVKGVTPQLLFGNDRNRNGIIDPDEDDGSDKTTQLGWQAYLTAFSRYQDLDSQNNPRIYLNDSSDMQGLLDNLNTALQNEALATYIVAARLYGTSSTGNAGNTNQGKQPAPKTPPARGGSSSSGSGNTLTKDNLDFTKRPQNINSVYDLIDSQVTIGAGAQAKTYASPLSSSDTDGLKQLLPLVLDKTTTTKPGTVIPARLNVNTAPALLLQALQILNQSIQDSDVQNILSQRPSLTSTDPPDPVYQTPAWLITQANLKPATLKALEKYITTRSQVYRVQSVGYFPQGGPMARIEAIIDTNGGMPRIIYWRDLTELGNGINRSILTGSQ